MSSSGGMPRSFSPTVTFSEWLNSPSTKEYLRAAQDAGFQMNTAPNASQMHSAFVRTQQAASPAGQRFAGGGSTSGGGLASGSGGLSKSAVSTPKRVTLNTPDRVDLSRSPGMLHRFAGGDLDGDSNDVH
eukprot:GFYU01024855.1.p1 GENE.GFYU01024855.1~~GFYU01024855.1.p1  ORF type:complete len:130 (-),score=22.08 GFYU01024855.1:17-406(-)